MHQPRQQRRDIFEWILRNGEVSPVQDHARGVVGMIMYSVVEKTDSSAETECDSIKKKI
jgi:hypothetical protein